MKNWNRRKSMLLWIVLSIVVLLLVAVCGTGMSEAAKATDFGRKNVMPCLAYPFGTDWMGRDMFARTIKGLSLSIIIGVFAAIISSLIAIILGICAATMGKRVDAVITWLIDLIMGVPHMLLLILICVACGRGMKGVVIGVAFTHWTSLARLIRAEVLQLKEAPYVRIAEKLGKSKLHIAWNDMVPHLIPHFLVGLVLMFPHAILHEASITFLGFGLTSEQPAIGIILSESMKYLVLGKWWLALFPGLALVLVVVLFYMLGENLQKLMDPNSTHE